MSYMPEGVSAERKNRVKELLFGLTFKCLMDKPHHFKEYAIDYFRGLTDSEDAVQEEESEDDYYGQSYVGEDYFMPPDASDYVRGRGNVVYSEPYNPEKDDDDEEEDQIFEKTEEQMAMLEGVVSQCLLFRWMDRDYLRRVINVMFPKDCQPGDVIIRQYDDGDNFYIIEKGLFEVHISPSPGEPANHVFTYQNAGSFGELALMYNMPRAATIIAGSEGKLWAMNRQTFRRVVLKGTFKKRKRYEELISKVPILKELTNYERMSLADALIPKEYAPGEIVLRQFDEPDGMYFVESGVVSVHVKNPPSPEDKEVCRIREGGYFGELALVNHQCRAATVKTITDVKLAFLDVSAFERILGPCLDLMKRNIDNYAKQIIEIFGTPHGAQSSSAMVIK